MILTALLAALVPAAVFLAPSNHPELAAHITAVLLLAFFVSFMENSLTNIITLSVIYLLLLQIFSKLTEWLHQRFEGEELNQGVQGDR